MGHRMPVDLIILSGFLGSGKTTLLVDFLRQDRTGETGVIVNEAGEIGVDGAIVADGTDGVPMTTLANGCVCCSLRSSLVQTVSALLEAARPPGRAPLERIILETSGLSRPGPIIASLADPELAGRQLRVGVVSTYDCESSALNMREFDEAAAQLAAAQRIVLTKVDRVSPDSLAHHRAVAAGINPLAQLVAETDRAHAVRLAFGATTADHPLAEPTGRAWSPAAGTFLKHPRIHVSTGTPRSGLAWDDVASWLDELSGFCGSRLLRFKALLHVTDCAEPILIQSVGTTFSSPRRMIGQSDARDVCVAITRDLDHKDINDMLHEPPVTFSAAGASSPGSKLGQSFFSGPLA